MTEQITIAVDSELAEAYRSASVEDRRKLDLLLNLRLREATQSGSSLKEIMLEISRNAKRRGLTPEKLEALFDEP